MVCSDTTSEPAQRVIASMLLPHIYWERSKIVSDEKIFVAVLIVKRKKIRLYSLNGALLDISMR